MFRKYFNKIGFFKRIFVIFVKYWFFSSIIQFSMTNDSKLKEDSFTLVTSQRRNKKKNKRLDKNQTFQPSEEDFINEEAAIKYVINLYLYIKLKIYNNHHILGDFTKHKPIYDCPHTTRTLLTNFDLYLIDLEPEINTSFALGSGTSASVQYHGISWHSFYQSKSYLDSLQLYSMNQFCLNLKWIF